MPLKRCLDELKNQKKLLRLSRLSNLSNLFPEELDLLQEAWKEIPAERRRQTIHQLVLLAESSFQLNFDSIFRICLQDPDTVVRARAIEGLKECEDCSVITTLVELIEWDKEEPVRAAAATALGKFALLAELGKVRACYAAKIEDALFAAIDNPEEGIEVRRRAIEAVGSLSLPQVKEIIQQAYQSQDSKLRLSALNAMGRNCDPLWLPILLRELSNPDPEMRFEAVKACGELGEEVLPYLTACLSDSDIRIQLAVIDSLKEIGGHEAKQALY